MQRALLRRIVLRAIRSQAPRHPAPRPRGPLTPIIEQRNYRRWQAVLSREP
jgi:hypothetical protein